MRTLRTLIAILAAGAIAIGIVMVSDARLNRQKIDLTAQHLYTLSPGTRAVLGGLREPVTLELFYSPRLGATVPSYGTLYDQVGRLLTEYEEAAHGMLVVRVKNPEPYSEIEDRALGFGLQAAPLDQGGEKVYFGLAGTNLLDDERAITFFQPERARFLEYDLTRLIQDLADARRPVVSVISRLPLDGDPRALMRGDAAGGRPYASMLALRQGNNVTMLPLETDTIPPETEILMVAAGGQLSDRTLYAIDQFVMRGGKLLVLTDPFNETLRSAGPESVNRLLDAWGIATDPAHVVGDPDGAWRVRAQAGGQPVDYPPWFTIREGIARDDPATADLTAVSVAAAGALAKKPGADIAFQPLLSSGARSGLIDTTALVSPDPAAIAAGFRPDGGPRVIAARVRGVLHSAFIAPPEGAAGPHLATGEKPAEIVVVADADLLADRFWVQFHDVIGQPQPEPFADNGPFVANIADTLAGSAVLTGLRARGDDVRPFTIIERLRQEAEARYRSAERALQNRLSDTEKKLAALRGSLGPDREAAMAAVRGEIDSTRNELRDVTLRLNRDIAALETRWQILDSVAVPALLILIAVAVALLRRRR